MSFCGRRGKYPGRLVKLAARRTRGRLCYVLKSFARFAGCFLQSVGRQYRC